MRKSHNPVLPLTDTQIFQQNYATSPNTENYGSKEKQSEITSRRII